MAASKDDLAEYLECGICLEKFEDPKVLSCQHLYCKKCLVRLVTRGVYEITCPECRQKTKVPNGDVSKLPSNHLINRLLSKRSDSKPSCKKHDGETLKLFCQSCDQLICRDCILIDHQGHKYDFVKDIFPAEKEKITKILEESKVNVRCLQKSIETLLEQEDGVDKNFLKVNQNIDSFIEKQIKILEQKRQTVKDELQKSVLAQKNEIQRQITSFVSSHASAKTSLEVIERTLTQGSEVDVLSAKNEIIQQFTKINWTTENLRPRGKVSYVLEANSPLDAKTVGEMTKIKEYDEEYKLTICSCRYESLLSISNNFEEHCQEALKSRRICPSTFCFRPKRKNSRFDLNDKVEVKIISPVGNNVDSPSITSLRNGAFSFRADPMGIAGKFQIEITINGRNMQGSPFTWEVGSLSRKPVRLAIMN